MIGPVGLALGLEVVGLALGCSVGDCDGFMLGLSDGLALG